MQIQTFKKELLPIKNKLFRFAKSMLHIHEDALQDVFIKLWKNKDIIADLKNPEAYAMKVMKNYCLDKIKSAKTIKIVGHDKNEIIITTDFKGEFSDTPSKENGDLPERAAGLTPLVPSPKGNTGIGLIIEKQAITS